MTRVEAAVMKASLRLLTSSTVKGRWEISRPGLRRQIDQGLARRVPRRMLALVSRVRNALESTIQALVEAYR